MINTNYIINRQLFNLLLINLLMLIFKKFYFLISILEKFKKVINIYFNNSISDNIERLIIAFK